MRIKSSVMKSLPWSRVEVIFGYNFILLAQLQIRASKIFPHTLIYISGYIWPIRKRLVLNESASNLQAIYANRISLTQCVQKLFNFEWNVSISLPHGPHHLLTIPTHCFFNYFWTGWARQVQFARLRRLLANLKGFSYVTYFSMIRWVSLQL